MKKSTWNILLLAALGCWSISCNKEKPEDLVPVTSGEAMEISMLPTLEELETKTYLGEASGKPAIYWGTGEYVTMWYNDGSDKFAQSAESSADANAGELEGSFSFTINPGEASAYSYGGFYPSSAVESPASSTVVMTLPAEQTAVPESYDPAAFLLVATPATGATIPNPLNVTFRRAVALNELTLTNVPESISSVTITAEGCTLAGGREINLATGASTTTFSGESESITVSYAEAQPAGTLKVYFTSWGASLSSGSVLKIRVDCPSGTWYRGGIAAGESGITLVENDLNKLLVNMSGAVARPTAAEAFAEAFAGELAVWEETTGAIVDLAGDNPAVGAEYGYGQYIPHDITVTANGVTYTKAQAFYVAGKLLQSLMGGGTMFNTALAEAPASCNWPQNSFNEGPGNGGPCKLESAKIDLLTTASSGHLDRAFTYLDNNGVFANFYGHGSNPTGYRNIGPTCMERVNLLLVRVFDYIVSNGLTSGFAAALQDVDFDADLYRATVPGTSSISAFAQQFVTVLDVWNSSIGSIQTQGGTFNAVHYVPESTTITFNGNTLTKAQMFSVAIRSLQLLYNGGTMLNAAPAADSFSMAPDSWLETTALAASGLPLETLNSLATRQITYGTNNARFANYCGFPNSNFDATSQTLSGMCCLERQLLCTARFFKYLLDNNITTGIVAACGNRTFSCDLYGTTGSVYGYVKCGSTPLQGVVVSDGYQVTATDANGLYSLDSEKKNGYVFISIPSGYKVSSSGVLPKFFKNTTAAAAVREQLDFSLTSDGDQTNHTMLVFGDIHLAARTNDRNQFKTFTTEINNYLSNHSSEKVYAMTLGDMTWDLYWYSNSYTFTNYLADVNVISGLQIFHTIGNHDHDMNATGDWNTVQAYKNSIAPNYYSFNIGQVHYMVVDNIECTNATASTTDGSVRSYNAKVVDYILDWIEKDLAYVDKDTPIVVTMHSPVWKASGANKMDNASAFAECFSNHTNVRFISGHTHQHWTVFKQSNIKECNSGAVCASWWWGGYYNSTLNITQDGAPGGYRIMSVNGTSINSRYKGTGRSDTYQFRTYDRNKIKITAADYSITTYKTQFESHLQTYGNYGTASSANQVLINVWDYNPNWKVEASEDNQHFTSCTRSAVYDPLYLIAYSAQRYKTTSSLTFKPATAWNMFTYTASSASATVYIKVTDDEGRVYTETMTRPKTFSLATYR